MKEKDIVIAYLRAEILIQQARKKALREYVYNKDFHLEAKVCERTEDNLKATIAIIQGVPK